MLNETKLKLFNNEYWFYESKDEVNSKELMVLQEYLKIIIVGFFE